MTKKKTFQAGKVNMSDEEQNEDIFSELIIVWHYERLFNYFWIPATWANSKFPTKYLTLSWRRSLSCRNQVINLLCKSLGWFLYDRDFRHERVRLKAIPFPQRSISSNNRLLVDLYHDEWLPSNGLSKSWCHTVTTNDGSWHKNHRKRWHGPFLFQLTYAQLQYPGPKQRRSY